MKLKIIVLIYALTTNTFANNIIDVFGTDKLQSDKIILNYSSKINEIENLLYKEFKNNYSDNKSNIRLYNIKKILLAKHNIIEKIKKEYGFLFVDFNTVLYPNNKNKYTTIEVVSKQQSYRLQFVSIEDKKIYLPKNDLIDQMINFEKLGTQMLLNGQLNSRLKLCPVYHCLNDFSHPKLGPYLKIFNDAALKDKNLIKHTLYYDEHAVRRASAAFLTAHFNNAKEIISTLLPSVNDPNSLVRNNVMRVIATTIYKAKIRQINVKPFINLLESTSLTDRNKALYVLSKLENSANYKKIIIQTAGNKLLQLLRLHQPNNKIIAYNILKKVSNKNFAVNDIISWENWLCSQAKDQCNVTR